MVTSKDIETKLLLIERKRLYNLLEKDRPDKNFGDIELINFGVTCSKYSLETKDWRFLNLALKILDSKNVSAEKFILRQEVEISLNVLKESI
tara:strand:- start:18144 stop:18419 length:276 start_codon:yes stop_codon:yes gene_type:complete